MNPPCESRLRWIAGFNVTQFGAFKDFGNVTSYSLPMQNRG